jgi:hypothetical protein
VLSTWRRRSRSERRTREEMSGTATGAVLGELYANAESVQGGHFAFDYGERAHRVRIDAVDTSHAVMVLATSVAARIRGTFEGPTLVRFERLDDGSGGEVTWQVIEPRATVGAR